MINNACVALIGLREAWKDDWQKKKLTGEFCTSLDATKYLYLLEDEKNQL